MQPIGNGHSPPVVSFVYHDRLYLNVNEGDRTKIMNGDLKGAGVRTYSKTIGALLELIGFAKEYTISRDNQTYKVYVNTNSLAEYTFRQLEAEKSGKAEKTTPEKIDELYKSHKEEGYNESKIKDIKQSFQGHIVTENQIKKFIDSILQIDKLNLNLKVGDEYVKLTDLIKDSIESGSNKDTLKDNIKTYLGFMIREIENQLRGPVLIISEQKVFFDDESDAENEFKSQLTVKLTVPEKNYILDDIVDRLSVTGKDAELKEAVEELRGMSVEDILYNVGRL